MFLAQIFWERSTVENWSTAIRPPNNCGTIIVNRTVDDKCYSGPIEAGKQ